jgi:hypothetical protein
VMQPGSPHPMHSAVCSAGPNEFASPRPSRRRRRRCLVTEIAMQAISSVKPARRIARPPSRAEHPLAAERPTADIQPWRSVGGPPGEVPA